jgi:hypothetical protein
MLAGAAADEYGQSLPHARGCRARRGGARPADAPRGADPGDRSEPAGHRRARVFPRTAVRSHLPPRLDPRRTRHGSPAAAARGRDAGLGQGGTAPTPSGCGSGAVGRTAAAECGGSALPSAARPAEHVRGAAIDALLQSLVLRRHTVHRGSMALRAPRAGVADRNSREQAGTGGPGRGRGPARCAGRNSWSDRLHRRDVRRRPGRTRSSHP